MNVAGLLALMSAWVSGGAIVAAMWPRDRAVRDDLGLIAPLGAIVGLAATSVIFFVASLGSRSPAGVGGVVEAVGTLVALWFLRRRGAGRKTIDAHPWTWPQWLLASGFALAVFASVVIAWRAYRAEPFGGWDGWAIWNLHARLMLRAGPGWPDLLGVPQLSWTHPDYPRLVPGSVARAWAWAGTESPAVSALVSVMFAGALLALLVAAVAKLRGRVPALLGGLMLIGTPFFVTFASNQHADIPLAACMLAAVILLVIGGKTPSPRLGALAGICAAAAAWTKNEGLLFAFVLALVVGTRAWREPSFRRAAGGFGLGLAVAILPVGAFKLLLAPTNDLMTAPLSARLAMGVDPARHGTVLAALWRDLRAFGEWAFTPWIGMALPFVAWRGRHRFMNAEGFVPACLGLMLAGFYAVYVTSPQDLAWHLDTSLVRLLLQLWPLALLAWCLVLPEIDVAGAAPPARMGRAVVMAANLALAGALVVVMSGQRATDELAIRRSGLRVTSAALGHGWFGIEQHGRDVWAWSAGNATLKVQLPEGMETRGVRLEFSLRSLGARQIMIRRGADIVWQGTVGDQFVAVRTPAITLPAGITTLKLITDAPAVTESAAAGARKLAFAIYNLRLENNPLPANNANPRE